jgi:two-component sensor histidine kinase
MSEAGSILIVDDDAAGIKLLLDHLNNCGYKVLVAIDAEAALQSIEQIIPDIILLDIKMPGVDGFTLASQLKERDTTDDIPIIFMTIFDEIKDKLKGFEIGAVDYITKPMQVEDVEARIKAHLRIQGLQKRLRQQNTILEKEVYERKKAEEQIRLDLREKENLLREIHHRVKNNFAVISSLLRIQSRRVSDPSVTNFLEEAELRIRHMGLVHEKLHQSENLKEIDTRKYLSNLAEEILQALSILGKRIELRMNIDSISLKPDTALPLGFIMSELLSNSIKHGFQHKTRGEISISLIQQLSDERELVIRDNGAGLPKDFNMEDLDSLGLKLVQTYVSQIGGHLKVIDNDEGATFKVEF